MDLAKCHITTVNAERCRCSGKQLHYELMIVLMPHDIRSPRSTQGKRGAAMSTDEMCEGSGLGEGVGTEMTRGEGTGSPCIPRDGLCGGILKTRRYAV